MPVDYSKWDNLELSDDSDIEVHPNVDKKSFIRAKQNQIHHQRLERKKKIETYKYEEIINDGLLKRINRLLDAFQSHSANADQRSPDELLFQAVMDSMGDAGDDSLPPRPEGVHTQEKDAPTFSKMLAVLVDQVKDKVEKNTHENRFDAYVTEIRSHIKKIEDLQKNLKRELETLERESSRMITSESYHTGFETSIISKPDSKPTEMRKTTQKVELLNPHALAGEDDHQSSEPDVNDSAGDNDDVEISELAKEFSKLKANDYNTVLQFIYAHPEIVKEKETDGLLVMAFNFCLENQDDDAHRCTHHGLLLQYCRALGRDGVGIFFKRITTPGHQAQKVFYDDVSTTFARIKGRAKEIQKQRAQDVKDGVVGVETIQLHAVDPGTSINIQVPPLDSQDPVVIEARKIFESFPPELQRALEIGSLDEVNKVLGKMSVDEAEEIVNQLGKGGMLSLEEEIIDATTEEGQKVLKKIEEKGREVEDSKMGDESTVGCDEVD